MSAIDSILDTLKHFVFVVHASSFATASTNTFLFHLRRVTWTCKKCRFTYAATITMGKSNTVCVCILWVLTWSATTRHWKTQSCMVDREISGKWQMSVCLFCVSKFFFKNVCAFYSVCWCECVCVSELYFLMLNMHNLFDKTKSIRSTHSTHQHTTVFISNPALCILSSRTTYLPEISSRSPRKKTQLHSFIYQSSARFDRFI